MSVVKSIIVHPYGRKLYSYWMICKDLQDILRKKNEVQNSMYHVQLSVLNGEKQSVFVFTSMFIKNPFQGMHKINNGFCFVQR